MAGYTRQSTFTDGDIINAADSNDEFNQLVNTFSNTAGHKHDGTSGEGPVIGLIGDPGVATPKNKVVVDDSNERVGFFIDVSGTSTEQFRVQDGVIVPVTTNDVDLGTSSLQFKDLYLDGTATVDGLVLGASASVTSVDTDLTSVSASDDTLASAKAIKDYVDTQLTAEDLDFQGDSGGALSVDLDSHTFTIAGGTGIDTSGATNTLTVAIDSTVATLTGTQTLTNKTLTTPIISSISNTGTLTLPTSTDTLVGRATTDTLTNKTLTSATLTSPVINTGVSGTAFLDDDTFGTATATTLASSESIKAYVDTTVAATNEVVEDTTPQLGGDLDLNSSDITGTGNINITGTIQSSGNITGTLATAAQPNITSVGTLTGFTSTGIDDNATSTAITIDSSEDINLTNHFNTGNNKYVNILDNSWNGLNVLSPNLSSVGMYSLNKILQAN